MKKHVSTHEISGWAYGQQQGLVCETFLQSDLLLLEPTILIPSLYGVDYSPLATLPIPGH